MRPVVTLIGCKTLFIAGADGRLSGHNIFVKSTNSWPNKREAYNGGGVMYVVGG